MDHVTNVTPPGSECQPYVMITTVAGLDNFDVKLPEASKIMGKKFACGASVGGCTS
jgi:hypothetical protein